MNSQRCWPWITLLAVILIQELLTVTSAEQCTGEAGHQSGLAFSPGSRQSSCKDIHEKYPEYRNTSGYYWMAHYCGMNYTGQSCEDIYAKNPEIRSQPGFYLINNQWVFCNMTAIAISNYRSTCAGVGEDGQKLFILMQILEMIAHQDGSKLTQHITEVQITIAVF